MIPATRRQPSTLDGYESITIRGSGRKIGFQVDPGELDVPSAVAAVYCRKRRHQGP